MRSCWSDKYFADMIKTYMCLIRIYWRVSHSSASSTYTQDQNLFITVPLDARVLDGTRPSAVQCSLQNHTYFFYVMKFHWLPTSTYCSDAVFHRHTMKVPQRQSTNKSQMDGTELCWGWDKMAAIFQKTFSNTFSWMKIYEFQLRFHWSLFLRVKLTIFKHWFRLWLGADQATSHHLNQWRSLYWCIYVSLGLNDLRQDYKRLLYIHDDVIKWKHFPHYWPFEWGIHRSPVISLHKGQWR